VQRCVAAHGGSIEFTSFPGEGTASRSPCPPTYLLYEKLSKSKKFSLVEDNESLRDQIVQTLELEGYEVAAANDGRKA